MLIVVNGCARTHGPSPLPSIETRTPMDEAIRRLQQRLSEPREYRRIESDNAIADASGYARGSGIIVIQLRGVR